MLSISAHSFSFDSYKYMPRIHQPEFVARAMVPCVFFSRAMWCGVVWCGVVCCGVIQWYGVVRCGVVWVGLVPFGAVRCGILTSIPATCAYAAVPTGSHELVYPPIIGLHRR